MKTCESNGRDHVSYRCVYQPELHALDVLGTVFSVHIIGTRTEGPVDLATNTRGVSVKFPFDFQCNLM